MSVPTVPPRFWDGYPQFRRPMAPFRWLGGAGGASGSDLWRGVIDAADLIVRAWPVPGPAPLDLAQIHRWLDRVRDLPFVAVPIRGREGQTWSLLEGRIWELNPFRPGAADLGRPPSLAHLRTMFAALGQFHGRVAAVQQRGPSPGLLARHAELTRLIDGEFATMRGAIERSTAVPHRALAERWLALAVPAADRVAATLRPYLDRPLDLRVCIRDVRPDHFLFTEDRLTGLVDFGAMGIDSVATDLARLLGETVGRDQHLRAAALESYAGSLPLLAADQAAIAPFEAANAVLGGARWVRWHFLEQRRFADPATVPQGLDRTRQRLQSWTESAD